jgi:hypothetical protein
MRTKEAIAQELATERAKLDELEHQLSTVRAKIDTLRAELQAARTAKPSPPPFPSLSPVKPRTPQPRRSNFSDRCFQGTPTSSPSDSSARKPPTPATHLLAPTNGSRVYVTSSPEANATALLSSSSP